MSKGLSLSLGGFFSFSIQVRDIDFHCKIGSAWASCIDGVFVRRINGDRGALKCSLVNHSLHVVNHVLGKPDDHIGNLDIVYPEYIMTTFRIRT